MTLQAAYRDDLRELIVALDDLGVFRPSEREVWEEGINEAGEMGELMTTAEALHKAMVDRESVNQVVKGHTEEWTQAFV